MSIATLRALHAIIGESIDQIDSIYTLQATDFPSLDKPYDGTSLGEVLAKTDSSVRNAVQKAVSACGHIAASLQSPFMSLSDVALGYHLPAALRVLEGLPHALPLMVEAGESGVHVKVIAEREGMNDENSVRRLAHIFRLLATHHILREISPGDIFALNRISGYMSLPLPTSKESEESDPLKRYDGTDGRAAYMGLCADEIFKASSYLFESLLPTNHPFAFAPPPPHKKGSAPIANSAPLAGFNYAFQTRQGYFPWLERLGSGGAMLAKEQDYRLVRFGKAMAGSADFEGPGGIWNAFDWQTLPQESVIVDVGGGIGSTTMVLAKGLQENGFRFIVQDRPPPVKLGSEMWREQCPELLDNKTVTFQVHDFFTPQPEEARTPAVYLLRAVIHDWPDQDAQNLLFRLREAASETTKLVIADHVLQLACADTFASEEDVEVEGVEEALASPPLLPNLGKANSNAYWIDLTMQTMFNSQERTLKEMVTLCASTGWKVTNVRRSSGSLFGYIVATPIPSFEVPPYVPPAAPVLPESPTEAPYERSCTPTFGSITSLPTPTGGSLRRPKFGRLALMNKKKLTLPPNTPPATPPEQYKSPASTPLTAHFKAGIPQSPIVASYSQPQTPVTPHSPLTSVSLIPTTPRSSVVTHTLRPSTSIPRLTPSTVTNGTNANAAPQPALKSPFVTPPTRIKGPAVHSPANESFKARPLRFSYAGGIPGLGIARPVTTVITTNLNSSEEDSSSAPSSAVDEKDPANGRKLHSASPGKFGFVGSGAGLAAAATIQ